MGRIFSRLPDTWKFRIHRWRTEHGHLGGHMGVTHTDLGLLEFFRQEWGARSFLDIGCGPGGMVTAAKKAGYEAVGVDGDRKAFQFNPEFQLGDAVVHDFVHPYRGPLLTRNFDIGWSVEFLEHVDPEYVPNYMALFQRCRRVMCTAAPPGKPGHHHVNCQPVEYWIEMFGQYGLIFSPELTEVCRAKSTMPREFVRETGMLFEREGS